LRSLLTTFCTLITIACFAQKDSATNAKENIVSMNFGVGIPLGTFSSSTGASEQANSPGYAMIGYSANILFEHRHPRLVTFCFMLGYNHVPFDISSYFANRIQNINTSGNQTIDILQDSYNKPSYSILSILPGIVFTKSNDDFVIDFHVLLGIITAKTPNTSFTGTFKTSTYMSHQGYTDTVSNTTTINSTSTGSLALEVGLTFRASLSEKLFINGLFDFTFSALSYSPTETDTTPYSYLPENWDVGSPISFPVSLFNATIGIGYRL
jgi:hypothetical protein